MDLVMGFFGVVLVLLGAVLVVGLYFLPTILGRKKKHSTGMTLVNFFFGWTLIGWIGSLIWTTYSPEFRSEWTYTCPHCGYKNVLDQRITLLTCKQCMKETKVASKKDEASESIDKANS